MSQETIRREMPDRRSIAGNWETGGKYPDTVTVAMSDGAAFRFRREGEQPGFVRSMEILRSWRTGKHERRAQG